MKLANVLQNLVFVTMTSTFVLLQFDGVEAVRLLKNVPESVDDSAGKSFVELGKKHDINGLLNMAKLLFGNNHAYTEFMKGWNSRGAGGQGNNQGQDPGPDPAPEQ